MQAQVSRTIRLTLPPVRWNRTGWRTVRLPTYFLLGLVLLELGTRAVGGRFERYAPDDYAERVAGCVAVRPNLLVVGGSPVAEGIDPAHLKGLTRNGTPLDSVYALGLSGATSTDVYHAVLRAAPMPPKLIVYGLTATDWNDARNEPHGTYSLMTGDDVVTCRSIRPDAAGWVTRHYLEGRLARVSAVFRLRNGIRLWAAVQADAIWPGCAPEALREAREQSAYGDALRAGVGYAPAAWFVHRRYDRAKAAGDPGPPFGFLDKYRTGSHLKYVDKLVAWGKAHQTEVILLDMPVTADLEARYASAFADYRSRLAAVEASGVPVIRATREAVGLGDEDFADVVHLNGGGAAKLSAWLRARLAGDRP
jgi:hypothetical protein